MCLINSLKQIIMKSYIAISIFLISIISSFSQNENPKHLNFILDENKKVTWQKIYETKASKDSLISILKTNFKSNFFTSDLSFSNDRFSGKSAKVKLSSTKGVAMGAYTPYLVFVNIDIKDNRYRVSVKDIIFESMETGISSGGLTISSTTPLTIEDFAVRNNKHEFRKNKTASSLLTILNKDLDSYFIIKTKSIKDDW